MPETLDKELRAAAFAALARITAGTGGVIRRQEMDMGFEFRGERIRFANAQQGIWRPRQLGSEGAALSITTAAPKPGVTPKYDDQIGSDDGWFEYKYEGKNPNTWTNVAVRRAMVTGAPLIYFYGLVPGVFEAMWPVYVNDDEPERLTFHLAVDTASAGAQSVFHGGSAAPLKAYSTVTAKRRLHQHKFRQLVLSAYRKQCAVCRFRKVQLLDAAHILPDRDERGLPEISNGLSLCRIHHGAYDLGILGVSPAYRVHIRQDVLDEKDGPMLLHGLQEMQDQLIHVPSRQEHKPNKKYLEERFEQFLAA
jgi:putative restriction endonuclease